MDESFVVNGNTWKYRINFWDDEPVLCSVEHKGIRGENQCNNPWNLTTSDEERAEIRAHKPARNFSPDFDNKPSTLIEYFNSEKIVEVLKNNIGSDCWLIYTTEVDNETDSVYFNNFIQDKDTVDLENEHQVREILCNNPRDLIKDLNDGKVIHIIMNHWFIDYVYRKVPNLELYTCVQTYYHFKPTSRLALKEM